MEMEFSPSGIISSYLKPLGYKKKGAIWSKSENGVESALVLTGSKVGQNQYLDIVARILTISNPESPISRDWSACYRLAEIEDLNGALIFNRGFANLTGEERGQRLSLAMETKVLDLLRTIGSCRGIAELWNSNSQIRTSPEARALLNLADLRDSTLHGKVPASDCL